MSVAPTPPAKEILESHSPSDGRKLGEVFISTPKDVIEAVQRARKAQTQWTVLGMDERNRILNKFRGVLLDKTDEIASIVSAENGKPESEVMGLILPLCESVKLYTKMAKRLQHGVSVSPTFFVGDKARIYYEPVGVAGFILPWNFPFELGVKHMIPALAAGNAVVQKPSEVNPLIGELIVRLFVEAGVPEDLVQMVHGRVDTATTLIDEADVICFVGSPKTGRKVMERAAKTLTPVVLELGGNDAAIVRSDADLELTAQGLVNGTCFNSGQVCNGIERIYVPKDLVDPLSQKILDVLKRLKQDGNGHRHLGPISWSPQLKIYESHTADALAKGATLLAGGKVDKKSGGLFWPPTLLTGMTHKMEMMREETFGPFLPIMAVNDDDEAIRLANDSRFGLGGSVWTSDIATGEAIARKIKTGSVMINNAVVSGGCVSLPFGGSGESGLGRVQGEQAYYHYTAPKSVMVSGKKAAELWMPYGENIRGAIKGLAKLFNGRNLGERIRGLLGYLTNRS